MTSWLTIWMTRSLICNRLLSSFSSGVSGAPAELQMTYQLTIVRQDGSWDVQSIGAATQAQPQGSP